MRNSIDLAWAAGFFDGEGCTGLCVKKKGGNTYCYPRIMVGQKDRDVLDKFKACVGGLGKIYGPYKHTNSGCYVYHYQVTNIPDVQKVLELLWPYLGDIKRIQAQGAFHKRHYVR